MDRGSDACHNLLRLVSRGSAIIAELLRLSDMVPSVFRLESKVDSGAKYASIIYDFSYFKTPNFEADFAQKLEANPGLQERDEEFKESFLDILTRFYLAFESIHKYALDVRQLVLDIEEGLYIQTTLEGLLLDQDGRQLLCEGIFLMGVMLLVLDERIEGLVREKMLVSYYRYSAERSSRDSNVDDVCNLLRSTGYAAGARRPVNYPDEFFRRTKLDQRFVELVIGRLRTDDIYNQLSGYPFPEHRSVALATQASMLFVCLFFAPEVLHAHSAVMREIVDRFFPDNWVINIHMGMTVNLIEAWEPYKSARNALANTLDYSNVRIQAKKHDAQLMTLLSQVQQLLQEGVLTEEVVLNKMNSILNKIRDANVTLRWLMLHTQPYATTDANIGKKFKQIKDCMAKESRAPQQPLEIFRLLLYTSQLELKCREIYQQLLKGKETKWEAFRSESRERMLELVDVFSGTKPLTRIEKNANLQQMFTNVATQIESLSFDDVKSVKKIVRIVQLIEEIQDLHQLESNVQVNQYVLDVKKQLHAMLKTSDLNPNILITLQIVGDLAYAWRIIDNYTVLMQKGIKDDPNLVIQLRATFLKLASALDLPLLRISQSGSPDLEPVSQYFSSELVAYVRKVLHIIPETMFGVMARIIDLQTNEVKELPTRLMKDQMRVYAQLEQRQQIAQLTHTISVFTEGILMMKTTLVGIIQIDPKKLLEDGIRKELVQQVAAALHRGLIFTGKSKQSEIISKLESVAQVMDGYRRSFEYIQDYVCIYGLKIWHEEVSRIINFNVEQECNAFIRQKVLDFDSVYQSRTAPIPKFPPLDICSVNFIGRLAREFLRITDPKSTIYVPQMRTWYDSKTKAEIVNPKLFTLMIKSIGTAGLNGLDRLMSFMINSEIHNIRRFMERNIVKDKTCQDLLMSFNLKTDEAESESAALNRYYAPLLDRAGRSWLTLNDALLRVGQMQLAKMSIAHELNTTARFESRYLISALETLNEAVLNQLARSMEKIQLTDDSCLLFELTNYLEWAGISDPLTKIYIPVKEVAFLDVILCTLVIHQMSKLTFASSIHGLTSRKPTDLCDGAPFLTGLWTFCHQFHESVFRRLCDRLSRYANHLIEQSGSGKGSEAPPDAISLVIFLRQLMSVSRINMEFSLPTPHPVLTSLP